ncbi:MAG TPA: MalY/PatB family protein [Candidatus Binatia bacterium]|nr:MalY/PatB family protein [Candidatus Binatia bacterium]
MTYDFDRVIERRHTESNKWYKFGPGVLPLWVADMDFPSPEPVVRALRERVEHGIYGYIAEQPEFYEVMTERLWKRFRWRVAPEAIILQPGVIPSFNMVARAVAQPGDGILMQVPVYPPILRCPGNIGLTRDEAPLARGRDGRYEIDWDAFARAIHPRTRMFLLCNPHNPVGRVFHHVELERMAELCLRHGLVICADEIHGDLVFAGQQHVPIATLGPEVEARTITMMAPSKTFNLAGLKASVAIIPDRALRERFIAARVDMVHGVNVFGYTALVAAYRDGQEWLDALLPYLEANRDFLAESVRARLPGVQMAPPEGTYLAWLDCREALPGEDPFTFFLEKARVAFNDGKTFGPGGEGFVRLNFGCPRPLLVEGLERMSQALDEARASRPPLIASAASTEA